MRFIRKFLFRTAIIVVLLTALIAVLAYFFPKNFLCVDAGPVQADVIVVLGGGLHERPEHAAELFKEHAAPRIIITGFGDAEINRNILLREGVPANAIELESKSRTTRENALFTIKLLRAEKVRSAILVTSWYHSRRGLATFEHFGPAIKFYSRPSYFAVRHDEWKGYAAEMKKRVYLEYIKLPGYWIYYGVCPF